MDVELHGLRSSTHLPLIPALVNSLQVLVVVLCFVFVLLRHAMVLDNTALGSSGQIPGGLASIQGGTIIIAPGDSQGISLELARRLSGSFSSINTPYFP